MPKPSIYIDPARPLSPHEHTDIVSLGPAERAILEFRLPRRGRYMFHPHQSHMAERGAMGWIVAI